MEVQNIDEHILPAVLIAAFGVLLLSSSIVFFFLRYRRNLIRQHEKMLKAELMHKEQLLQANIRSQEAERMNISRELHDHVGNTLSTLTFLVDRVRVAAPRTEELEEVMAEYKQTIGGLVTDIRNISHSLAPPGLAIWGLAETISDHCAKKSRNTGIEIQVRNETRDGLKHLPVETALALFRVVQELLTNTVKHAKATLVTIVVKDHGLGAGIAYTDNGVGAPAEFASKKGIGIRNIDSRLQMVGAAYRIDTAPGRGFSMTIDVPPAI